MRNKKQSFLKSAQQGFSLIEILVVISIIALLISVVAYSLVSARIKARNSRRALDLSQLQKGLEIYKSNNNSDYPSSGTVPSANTAYALSNLSGFLVPDAINQIPADPSLPAGNDYQYAWGDSGKMYAIRIYLSNEVGGTDCAYRSPGVGGVTNNLFTGLPVCDLE
ncbi:MAG: prepilin-type N-terminal cleavage/methylation domain-containing protein [Candidatus Doudnabacteria bacterium]